MSDARKGDGTRGALTDADRLLLFEWHASHLESWIRTFASGRFTTNYPRGASAEDFHRAAMTSALLRKFYTKSEPIALPHVVRSMAALYTGENQVLIDKFATVERDYQSFLDVPITVEDENGTASGIDLAYDLIYGLLIHGDADRGARLRERGRTPLHSSAIQQSGWEPIVEALRTIEHERSAGTFEIGPPLKRFW